MFVFTRNSLTALSLVANSLLLLTALTTSAALAQDASGASQTPSNTLPQPPSGKEQPPPNTPPNAQPQQPPAEPQKPKPKRRFYLGPNLGVYLPTDSKTQRRFGSTWFNFGLGVGAIAGIRPSGRISPDLHFLSQSNNGNRAFVGMLGIEYRRPLFFGRIPRRKPAPGPGGQPGSEEEGQSGPDGPNGQAARKFAPYLLPYIGVSADFVFADLRSVADGVHSGLRYGGGGSGFLGLKIGQRAFFEARYTALSTIKSFNLSGFQLSTGYRFSF